MAPIPLFIFKKHTDEYQTITFLERVYPHRVRRWLVDMFLFFTIVFLVLTWGYDYLYPHIVGMFFLSIAILLKLVAAEAMYYSYRFRETREPYIFELSLLLSKIGTRDVVYHFIRSYEGGLILKRAGFRPEYLKKYADEHTVHVPFANLELPQADSLFESFLRSIYRADAVFKHLLQVHGLSENEFVDAAFFAMYADRLKENRRRWWHISPETIEFQEKLMRALLPLERKNDVHLSHGAFDAFQDVVPEDDTFHDMVSDLFIVSAGNVLQNGRSVILRLDVVED